MRITPSQMQTLFSNLSDAASAVGVDTSRWELVQGSSTYRRAWKVVNVDPETGRRPTVFTFSSDISYAYAEMQSAFNVYRSML